MLNKVRFWKISRERENLGSKLKLTLKLYSIFTILKILSNKSNYFLTCTSSLLSATDSTNRCKMSDNIGQESGIFKDRKIWNERPA